MAMQGRFPSRAYSMVRDLVITNSMCMEMGRRSVRFGQIETCSKISLGSPIGSQIAWGSECVHARYGSHAPLTEFQRFQTHVDFSGGSRGTASPKLKLSSL